MSINTAKRTKLGIRADKSCDADVDEESVDVEELAIFTFQTIMVCIGTFTPASKREFIYFCVQRSCLLFTFQQPSEERSPADAVLCEEHKSVCILSVTSYPQYRSTGNARV